MSGAVKPLSQSQQFAEIMTAFSNPLLGVLAGFGITAIIQSSSATSGILLALSTTGQMTYGAAIPIIMGQNIGTCVTALISSIGAKKNAKRAAMIHLYFNLIGSTLVMVVFYGLKMFINFGFEGQAINAVGIAVIHSLFNIVTTLILLPFSKKLVRLAELTIRDKKDEKDDGAMDVQILDERLFTTPTVAIERAREVTCDLAGLSKDALKKAIEALDHYSDETDAFVRKTEEKTDIYEDRLGAYPIRLSSKELSIQGRREVFPKCCIQSRILSGLLTTL